MTIYQLQRNLTAVNVQSVALDAVEATKDNIADLNVLQMNRGLRSDGSEITPSYSNLTIELKKAKGQPTDRVTLFDTGGFQQAITTSVTGKSIVTGSSDIKSAKLEKKYSKKRGSIFGLSEKYKDEYIRENLEPEFVGDMRDKIFKK